MKRFRALTCFVVLLMATGRVLALDYASVAASSAILYDGPALKAKKLYVVSRYAPLEVVVNLGDWVKVRDQGGSLAWVEKRALGTARYVVVSAALADVRRAPEPAAALVFQVRKQVALEWMANTGTGWLKVRHPGGAVGYVKALDVWGD